MSTRRDRGQAAILVTVIAATLFVASAIAVAEVGRRVVDRTSAQTAADAAALAALDGGRSDAETMAAANGATVVAYVESSASDGEHGTVTVTVRVGSSTASARATRAP